MIAFGIQKPWLRKPVFLGANLLVALVCLTTVVWPMRDWLADRDAQILQQRETLARWRAIAAQDAAVRALATQSGGDDAEFLQGKNEGVIQAEMQGRLKGLVEKAGARLRSMRGLQAQADPAVRYVGARVELFGPIQAVHRAVTAIETGKPLLFVKGAMLRPLPTPGPPGVAQEPTIEAQLDVYGVVRIEGTSP